MTKRHWVSYALLALVAGLLHYAWETSHVGLYTGYGNLGGPLPVTLYATLGDILYTFLAVIGVGIFKRDMLWWLSAHMRDFALLAIIGLTIALFVEYKALWLGTWEYLPTMPIIPILNVGLSPIVQMTILLPLSVTIVRWIHSTYTTADSHETP